MHPQASPFEPGVSVAVEADERVDEESEQAAHGYRGAVMRVEFGLATHVHLEVVAKHVDLFVALR